MPMESKTFAHPDERRAFRGKGYFDVLTFGDVIVGRGVFEPGWRWSEHVRPIVGTPSCRAAHTLLVTQGSMRIRMDDGDELDIQPGDVARIPPGHDAWVLGDEACIVLDFSGAEYYARQMAERAAPSPAPM